MTGLDQKTFDVGISFSMSLPTAHAYTLILRRHGFKPRAKMIGHREKAPPGIAGLQQERLEKNASEVKGRQRFRSKTLFSIFVSQIRACDDMHSFARLARSIIPCLGGHEFGVGGEGAPVTVMGLHWIYQVKIDRAKSSGPCAQY
ncbi:MULTISPECIES: hypothetical protein [Rhizobium]|uniref:hypothetical protein n=1 Tax=Rhizobium TaxID=379 RepID=UPI000462E570|nr:MULTISPECIES: hypothetical protein [Rhizobium]MCA0806759.1 hypothetical protein [Rhizobium sp. T1473]MCS0462021.1 hypothetical protein [Rhizobium favelukesii]UFS85149.1 hypothetical protein LPB79_36260 [Rhizobium sp. T136]